MMKNKILFLFFLFISSFAFSETLSNKWVIAAAQFEVNQINQNDKFLEGISKTIPQLILEKLDANIVRNIYPDEKFERKQYELKKERMSLFLQLSSLTKTRDSFVLYNYTETELKLKQREQDKKINDVKKKINENLEKLKESEAQFEEDVKNYNSKQNQSKNDFQKFVDLFKHFFSSKDDLYTTEDVAFYNNSFSNLYVRPAKLIGKPYESKEFELEMVNAKINTLLTGKINKVGDFYSITVDAYLYPGAKKIITVTDVGSANDFEMICTNIARSIIPVLSNAIPVEIVLNITNEDIKFDQIDFFIDDALQSNVSDQIIVQSGVHYIQFVCPGYKSISTSYYFEGNKKYKIDITFEKEDIKTLNIQSIKPVQGTFYANGTVGIQENEFSNKAKIKINDTLILGSFISSDGKQGFFYIPEKLVIENANLAVKLNLQNKGETVESRRKKMYWSYSLLTISLMPTLFTYGNLNSTINRYNNGKESISTVKNWQTGFYVSAGISIGCGIFFVYELVRYLMAANQVVPNKARFAYQSELEEETFQEPVIIQDEDSDSQNGLIINDEKKENEIIIVEE
ncbi:MAG: hypothetical protein E7059_09230 [Treponema bryantii]|nr:hypothetical protein [Treponema bryantii]